MKKMILIIALILVIAVPVWANSTGGIFNEHWLCSYLLVNLSDELAEVDVYVGAKDIQGDFRMEIAGNDSEIILLRDMVDRAFSFIGSSGDDNFYDTMAITLDGDESLKVWIESDNVILQGPFVREVE